VSVIDTTTQAVVRSIDLKGAPQGVAVTPTGAYAYVVTRSPDAVSIISTSNGGSRSVSVGFSPAVFGNFIGPNLITDVLEVSSEQALTGLGFGRFVDF
jgi:DNA-binding beta-propeller fold protein YncE